MSGGMSGMDIRLPMGLMFAIIGAVIAIYGMMTGGDPMYTQHSLGININLWWGLVMAVFGVIMLILALLPKQPGA
ncbi:MAG: hypothetical protein ACTHN5_13615 [Phycisphaerae bacterium]